MDLLKGSLDRKLQRPLLAKSRTLPSIPQSPTVTRAHKELLSDSNVGRTQNKLLLTTESQKGYRVPSFEKTWRREDDGDEIPEDTSTPWNLGTEVNDSPFTYFRSRSVYMKKSISVDEHLGWLEYSQDSSESKMEKVKVNLRRKFSLGSADKKDSLQKRLESSKLKLTQRFCHKERYSQHESAVNEQSLSCPRPRSLSLDWPSSPKMTQQMRDLQLIHGKKLVSPSSPNAAKRLYRNLSGKFKVNYTSFDETNLIGRNEKNKQRKSCVNFHSNEAVFEAVEQQDLDAVQMLLNLYSTEELDLNTPNSEGLMPLDIAIMTNNVPMAKMLLQAGAKESPHFVSLESRALHLTTLVRESEQRVSELTTQVLNETPNANYTDKEKQLKAWEWHYRLFKRMKAGFEHARAPEAPTHVQLSVASSTSLQVTFHEPLSVNSAVVTKYKVEWSTSHNFSSITGEALLDDMKTLLYTMTGLVTGISYYVRVSAYNMKGWGPPQISTPACATPSNWRECNGKEVKHSGQTEALDLLLNQIKNNHQHCLCHENSKIHLQGRKHSMSKSLKHLFQPTSKFVKTLKRGLYLTVIFYKDNDIIVTHEEQIPVVEMDDSYSSSLMQDFLWFTKVSCMWEDSRWLGQRMCPSLSSCSSVLQARHKMLVAVAQLQGLLGTQNLGHVYFEPIKDKHGNVLIVTLKELSSYQSLENVRWIPLSKLQTQRKSLSSSEDPTALDMLLLTLHEKLAYHRRSNQALSPGLYLGYLKLCSSVDQIHVLVPQKLPNVLCHIKIRNNHNVSRDEWEWLQNLSDLDEATLTDPSDGCSQILFQRELRVAILELMNQIGIPLEQAKNFRLYSQEVLDFADNLSFLLLLPPSDDVCAAPGQNKPNPCSGFLTLPLQIFELVHFFTYDKVFISQYCQVSALLELDLLLSQQALREAFSDSEVVAAKQRHQQVQDFIQQMEEIWRDVRWIMDVLQYARYKQPPGGIPLTLLMDFTTDIKKDNLQSVSSNLDYLPSPTPSPETNHKHPTDSHGISDEEGSSEVFLATDSDYDSSRAQSPREVDLICLSALDCSKRSSHNLRDGAPDVLQAHELKSQQVSCSREDTRHTPLYDSDFVLPSRQLELLHITEKRQAYCVRTSSFDIPTQTFHVQRKCWSRPESMDEYPTEQKSNGSSVNGHRPSVSFNPNTPLHSDNISQLTTHSKSQDFADWINPHQESLLKEEQIYEGNKLKSVSLRVYPQYHTGLSKEISVKLHVTGSTSAREIIKLVIKETNEAAMKMNGDKDAQFYRDDQLDHFGLVLSMDNTEKWLQDDFLPLSLQNPWTKGRLYVRIKEYSPLLLQHGKATTV
ncbi:ankyrin repeat and fibronectin type-III domain-containing protein 1-like isoform X1 [Rhincodon typus]|uniref:ankyrin repeat and fibronectin type-III domain-containing protein 1-like isoform X1 n=2 Tax=Rhincodon typus TaxID=259920 RepID=UPI00202FA33D|nr:ankyrin repeat and fibronectin type-III domain-containing protein 1-like isoform X1 [Rhincodon typus]XP_048465751.1 ankyrin repeat and fibronectin type-III domain-containing protein 1-like isoform X1 [Rhincodon typus]